MVATPPSMGARKGYRRRTRRSGGEVYDPESCGAGRVREFLGGALGPLGHRLELRPHDRRIDIRGLRRGAEPAVGTGHDVLPPDERAVPHQPLRDQVRMLDVVVRRVDDAGG